MLTMAMEVENASLCNVVIKYLLDQQYLLTAFELMHELIEDGHADRVIRLQQIFSDPEIYPPEEMLRLQNLQIANPQRVVEERDAAEERATIMEYELRLAKDDIKRLQQKLEMQGDSFLSPFPDGENIELVSGVNKKGTLTDANNRAQSMGHVRDPLRESERMALNWAVKEYLLSAGYKLTAMTFYEEVDQDLDTPHVGPMYMADALRHCYQLLIAASPEAIQEKMALQEDKDNLLRDKEQLLNEKGTILKTKEVLTQEILSLKESLEASRRDVEDRDQKISELKDSLQLASNDINGFRMEITALKLELESLRASTGQDSFPKEDATFVQESIEIYKAEIESLKSQLEMAKSVKREEEHEQAKVKEGPLSKDVGTDPMPVDNSKPEYLQFDGIFAGSLVDQENRVNNAVVSSNAVCVIPKADVEHKDVQTSYISDNSQEVKTVEVLADALPKIVPYVLINHREELLPLIMCAIERHPDSKIRDLLTHTLFNLIKRPDEKQRRIIMDACVLLAKNIGEERTELELLPQCWEQINHKYEERRLLVAQSCGELARFVKVEMRTSLILSIIQQLVEDPEAVVREAASHNLAILLPLFPSTDKYFKVEELMFQLLLDPSGVVVDTTLKELVPAVITWARNGNQPLSQLLRVLSSHILSSAQRCPPISGVEGSMEARLRVLGERERWNLDVLLRMLFDLLPEVVNLVKATCPFKNADLDKVTKADDDVFFSDSLIEDYLRGQQEWPTFDWLHCDCIPLLLQVACMLSSREDSIRSRLSKLLAGIISQLGQYYLSSILLPIFLTAVGDNVNFSQFPANLISRFKALRPRTEVEERLATLCVLPLLLAGVLGVPSMQEHLALYLRSLVMQQSAKHGALTSAQTPELIDALRFLCIFEEHHSVIIGVIWDLVVNSNPDVKISAASIMKVLVPYVNAKSTTQDILPALVTLGSDPNLLVKYSSIEAFGAIAQHFKDEVIMDKIRVQMDAFLEDGSHEATVAVIRTLAMAVPLTTSGIRDYLLQKLLVLTGVTLQGTMTLMRRREKVDAFCEAVRALDATDLSSSNVKEFLLPVIQNLLKDIDALDPAHKEALELILKERSGGRLETITKAMGNHLNFTGVTSLFGDSGFLAKKETLEAVEHVSPKQATAQEDGRLFNRFMRSNFSEMIRGRNKNTDE
ncbi:hypothetical protein KP509_07G087500 [Ceratopteris richardii]|uniref:Uncharacterized protein n=1 Tax=Ceratopteris richardii TaxID=49495 RepID=A0A8T2UC10_CERRI|nr:hypothetical protein KP509_07G087500 [Ceratopteris richardii]